MAAGAIHGSLTTAHFQVWWAYGLFFLVAALAQVLWGLALVTDAINPRHWGDGWRRARRRLLIAGATGNLALLVTYVVSRTTGVPLGPEQGPQSVAVIDVVATMLELTIVALVAAVLRSGRTPPDSRG